MAIFSGFKFFPIHFDVEAPKRHIKVVKEIGHVNEQNRVRAGFLALVSWVVLTSSCLTPSYSQTPQASSESDVPAEVTFHLVFTTENAPITLKAIYLGGREIPLDTPVAVNGKWLRTLQLVVQNGSKKPIVNGSVVLSFPETGDGSTAHPAKSSYLSLGQHPASYFFQRNGKNLDPTKEANIPQIRVLPGKSMTFEYGDYQGMKHASGDVDQDWAFKSTGRLTKVDITWGRFYFSDGGAWLAGQYALPEPAPVLWKTVTADEFFAHSSAN